MKHKSPSKDLGDPRGSRAPSSSNKTREHEKGDKRRQRHK